MEREPEQSMDLRGTPCPMNWVKAKLRLEEMAPGQVLEIVLDDGDAIRNVPGSVKAEGHRILRVTPDEGCFRLLIERAAPQGDGTPEAARGSEERHG